LACEFETFSFFEVTFHLSKNTGYVTMIPDISVFISEKMSSETLKDYANELRNIVEI